MKLFIAVFFMLIIYSDCQFKQGEHTKAGSDRKYRPQYHFTPSSQWMNDPNGMVYYEGEYHLFYQHYPDSNVWGPMHWGHAVSTDMINWEHLPVALYPDSLGYIFSGSAVIDWDNTSGLGSAGNPPMVAIYTYHDPVGAEQGRIDYETQGIAYSLDKGRTWTKYAGNPVLKNPGIADFRDPKVYWDRDQWVMTLAVKDHIEFYTSQDLITWEKLSEFGQHLGAHGGVWECPDLFPLIDASGTEKWILLVSINPGGPQGGSATQYFVGDFDGQQFTPEDTLTRWLDVGADNYAGVTWSDVPEDDGRRLFIGWMSNWHYANIVPTEEWRSAMTIPRSLKLITIDGQYFVQSDPVKELDKYLNDQQVNSENGSYSINKEHSLISLSGIEGDEVSIRLSNALGEYVTFSITPEKVAFDRTHSGLTDFYQGFGAIHTFSNFPESVEQIDLYLDRSSVEVFVNNGELVMTELIFPKEPYTRLSLEGNVSDVNITTVRSIWNEDFSLK